YRDRPDLRHRRLRAVACARADRAGGAAGRRPMGDGRGARLSRRCRRHRCARAASRPHRHAPPVARRARQRDFGSPRAAPGDAALNASKAPNAAPDEALVVVAPIKSALRLTALNDAAAGLGLKVGMTLADARAMHPRLIVADADPLADQQILAAIADWCDR